MRTNQKVKEMPKNTSSRSYGVTPEVQEILSKYESDSPGVKANIARILMHGKLAGTGKMVILPVDQGFEHGPARSFAVNPDAYDPHYHYQLAIDSGCNAYAAPLGSLEAGADTFAGAIPLILKINSSNSLVSVKDQSVNGSVQDALRLGCSAIGFTIYPGSEFMLEQQEEIRALSEEAKSYGIATVMWSYVRGPKISKEGETAIDTIAYGAHMAALLGAHIIKVKLPTDHLEQPEAKKVYEEKKIPIRTQAERVRHIMQCSFNNRRLVVFSGGATKDEDSVFEDARAIYEGGGNGSIIGRNCFQRPRAESIAMLDKIMDIYLGKDA
jgi:fructose-bisphosphate aldolase, class I